MNPLPRLAIKQARQRIKASRFSRPAGKYQLRAVRGTRKRIVKARCGINIVRIAAELELNTIRLTNGNLQVHTVILAADHFGES